MKKIVTALIIVLPLVFLIALFAITSVASVSADIPANGLVINNKGVGVFSFDLANYQNKMYEQDLGVEVLPYMAKNKKIFPQTHRRKHRRRKQYRHSGR